MLELTLDSTKFLSKPNAGQAAKISKDLPSQQVKLNELDFKQAIESGQTWSACFDGKSRKLKSWTGQQLFSADIDDSKGMTEKDILELCETHCVDPFLIHHSFSSKPSYPKYRVILKTEKLINDPSIALGIQKQLTSIFGGDPVVCDLARIYYGGKPESVFHFDPEATLDLDEFDFTPCDPHNQDETCSIPFRELDFIDAESQLKLFKRLKRTHKGRYNLLMTVIEEQKSRVMNLEEGSGYMSVWKATLRLSKFRELYNNMIQDSVTQWVDSSEHYRGWKRRSQLDKIIQSALKLGRSTLYDIKTT